MECMPGVSGPRGSYELSEDDDPLAQLFEDLANNVKCEYRST